MRNDILETLKQTLLAISRLLPQLFPPPAYEQDPKTLPMNQEPKSVPKDALLSAMLMAISRHEGWTVGEIRHDPQ